MPGTRTNGLALGADDADPNVDPTGPDPNHADIGATRPAWAISYAESLRGEL
jgi:hypothetical protein